MKRIRLLLLAVVTLMTACRNMPDDPEITTTDLPPGSVGIWYDFTLEVDQDGNQWRIETGSLPSDLSLDQSKGRIYGTPLTAGTYPLLVCNWWVYWGGETYEDCHDFTLTIAP